MMPHDRYTVEQIASLGAELYNRQIRDVVGTDLAGQYLVVDIETAEYEIGPDYLALSDALLARHPGAALYAMRIGHMALGSIGGTPEALAR
jgi:hypothetical protein